EERARGPERPGGEFAERQVRSEADADQQAPRAAQQGEAVAASSRDQDGTRVADRRGGGDELRDGQVAAGSSCSASAHPPEQGCPSQGAACEGGPREGRRDALTLAGWKSERPRGGRGGAFSFVAASGAQPMSAPQTPQNHALRSFV